MERMWRPNSSPPELTRPKLYETEEGFLMESEQAQKSRWRRGVRFKSFVIFDSAELFISL
jgi:hypothetical protein